MTKAEEIQEMLKDSCCTFEELPVGKHFLYDNQEYEKIGNNCASVYPKYRHFYDSMYVIALPERTMTPTTIAFYKLAVGEEFTFCGKKFVKTDQNHAEMLNCKFMPDDEIEIPTNVES